MGRITFSLNCLEMVIFSVTCTSSGRHKDTGEGGEGRTRKATQRGARGCAGRRDGCPAGSRIRPEISPRATDHIWWVLRCSCTRFPDLAGSWCPARPSPVISLMLSNSSRAPALPPLSALQPRSCLPADFRQQESSAGLHETWTVAGLREPAQVTWHAEHGHLRVFCGGHGSSSGAEDRPWSPQQAAKPTLSLGHERASGFGTTSLH